MLRIFISMGLIKNFLELRKALAKLSDCKKYKKFWKQFA